MQWMLIHKNMRRFHLALLLGIRYGITNILKSVKYILVTYHRRTSCTIQEYFNNSWLAGPKKEAY